MATGRSDTYVNPLVKYLLFAFNFLFWLISLVFILVGAWAYMEKNVFIYTGNQEKDIEVYDLVFDLTVILMVLGSAIFILAFAGCLGALRENVCLLKVFSYSLGALLLIQIILAILAFVFSAEVKVRVGEVLKYEVLERYREDDDLKNLIDWFQKTFTCCGVGANSFLDWSRNPYFNCSDTNVSVERCAVPYSCCLKPDDIEDAIINTMCGYRVQRLSFPEAQLLVYTKGCLEAVLDIAQDNLFIIGGVVVGLVIPQIFGIFLARVLTNQVLDQRERWL